MSEYLVMKHAYCNINFETAIDYHPFRPYDTLKFQVSLIYYLITSFDHGNGPMKTLWFCDPDR